MMGPLQKENPAVASGGVQDTCLAGRRDGLDYIQVGGAHQDSAAMEIDGAEGWRATSDVRAAIDAAGMAGTPVGRAIARLLPLVADCCELAELGAFNVLNQLVDRAHETAAASSFGRLRNFVAIRNAAELVQTAGFPLQAAVLAAGLDPLARIDAQLGLDLPTFRHRPGGPSAAAVDAKRAGRLATLLLRQRLVAVHSTLAAIDALCKTSSATIVARGLGELCACRDDLGRVASLCADLKATMVAGAEGLEITAQTEAAAAIYRLAEGLREAATHITSIVEGSAAGWPWDWLYAAAEAVENCWLVPTSQLDGWIRDNDQKGSARLKTAEILAEISGRQGGAIRATPFGWPDVSALPRREWVYGQHLIRGFVSLTVAPGATGKSSLLIADALAMASGRDLLGTGVHGEPKRVWAWNLEDPSDELARRIHATAQHYGVGPSAIGDRLFVDSGRDQALCIAKQLQFGAEVLEPVVEALAQELLRRRIDVLIVDPFVSSHQVSENDNGAIDLVAKAWGRLADQACCAIELVHHLRKSPEGVEATAESARGAVALVAAARSVRVLNRMTRDEAESAGLPTHRGFFRVGYDKENLAPASEKADWFRIAGVDLPNGPVFDGASLPGDSVGVVAPWSWPDPFDGLTDATLIAVQRAVADKGYRANPQAKEWVGNAVGEVLGLDPADKGNRRRIVAMIKTWISNGALAEVSVPDGKGRIRPVIEVGKWATTSPT